MYYDALKNDHGLPHDPVNAIVAPRPIGWISSLSNSGTRNLAPYSYFNLIASRPALVVYGSSGMKDSRRNIEATGEFVCNIVNWDLREAMNRSSAAVPHEVDEFDLAGLEAAPSRWVKPPRVKRAPAALECRHVQTVALPSADPGVPHFFSLIIGQVVGVYIDDDFIQGGLVDVTKIRPVARLGYFDYSVIDSVFAMPRP
jgi:flavin reductase (DIM6/NTAB) family NADH-FMN oxidoreductase RutF